MARYLERTDRRVYALVRGADDRDAEARMRRTLLGLFGPANPYAGRVVAVRGDITRAGLGVPGGLDWLAEEVSEIVHGAASVSFDQRARVDARDQRRRHAARARVRRALPGSRHAAACVLHLHRVCRRRSLRVLQRGRPRRRPAVSQHLRAIQVRGRVPDRPRARATADHDLRPSIIVGERRSGWTSSFNVLYWPLRAFARGAYFALPARGEAPVDVVPVDYVADAIFTLSQSREAEGTTFHITAGTHVSSVAEVIELATTFFKRPAPHLLEPSLYHRVVHPLLVRTAATSAAAARWAQRDLLPLLRDAGRVRQPSRPHRAARPPGRDHAAEQLLRAAHPLRARSRMGAPAHRARDRHRLPGAAARARRPRRTGARCGAAVRPQR